MVVHYCLLSITNGHGRLLDMPPRQIDSLSDFARRLKALSFVKTVTIRSGVDELGDGLLDLETTEGHYQFVLEVKRSFLDQSVVSGTIIRAQRLRRKDRKLLLFAPYVPPPTADRLIDNNIAFADLAGNMHLDLGGRFHWTVVGRTRSRRQLKPETFQLTPTSVRLLFTMAARPESAGWTVRQLAEASGVGKSTVSNIRAHLEREARLQRIRGHYQAEDPTRLRDQLLAGYHQLLRPKSLIGRFEAAEAERPEGFLGQLTKVSNAMQICSSVTGTVAARMLSPFYEGPGLQVFLESLPDPLRRELKMLPDEHGSIVILEARGELPFWEVRQGITLAHPWLIFAELMTNPDPRAHEAAELLYEEFLRKDR